MTTKLFEVRDRMTLIALVATQLDSEDEREKWLLGRVGFFGSGRLILVSRVDGQGAQYEPYGWPRTPRTVRQAHHYIENHWDELTTGDVIDVEFILGETKSPKTSERER